MAAPSEQARKRAASAGGGLDTYRAKRDFAKTPEPAGAKQEQSEGHRFVIQKHAARRLHYDLRLELDGVFKSWAVTRGPSLDATEKRLAVHVEDHPLDYGDFEGVIPQGEYGGGTVMIWDRGEWLPEGDPGKGYAKGHLAFTLEGEKLHGRWHLIRTRPKPREKKEQWLLFKVEDEFARPAVEGDILEDQPDSAATGRTMTEIAENRDAVWSSRGGLIEGVLSPENDAGDPPSLDPAAIKGARKAPLPDFIPPSLALLAAYAPQGEDWLHEIKFDGYRLMAHLDGGGATLMTRGEQDWTQRFPLIAEALKAFPAETAIIDGEAVVEDENGVSDFVALQAALSGEAGHAIILRAFDLLYLDGYDLREAPLIDRKVALQTLLSGVRHKALRYSEHIEADGAAMLDHACRLGLEGIISKKRGAPYRSGRSGGWLKIKCTNRSEFVIGGYVPSTATRNAVGSLLLGYYDESGGLIYVGRTGTGFSRNVAQSLYKTLSGLKTKTQPFAGELNAEERRGAIFVEPELVAEIEFRSWTGDRRLRHAAFKGLREDKPASEVRLEASVDSPSAQTGEEAMATDDESVERPKPARAGKSGNVDFEGVTLTHPDRILWEDAGLTKLGLAEFYAGIAGRILPHVTGRPLALVRCPSGTSGECFFQKHAFAGLTEAVEVVPIEEKEGKDETLVIRDLKGLISLVQANVLEIHPWGARIEDIEHPDRIILDLDPGEGVAWEAVIETAREVRRRLAADKIESFVKTSGGKGLHVVAPIQPSFSWDEAKDYCRRIAQAMEKDTPSLHVATMAKKLRTGKVFIDYLRNGRGATAIATYSTRAKAGAPVSTPVGWDELGPALTSARFNVGNLPRRLAHLESDPWQDFFALKQKLPSPPEAAPARKRSKITGKR